MRAPGASAQAAPGRAVGYVWAAGAAKPREGARRATARRVPESPHGDELAYSHRSLYCGIPIGCSNLVPPVETRATTDPRA